MRQLLLAAIVGGTAVMSGFDTAVAQVVIEVPGAGVYLGPTYHHDHYYSSHGPRYYRGYRYYDDTYRGGRQLRSDRHLCGRYAYWDGNACQPGRRP